MKILQKFSSCVTHQHVLKKAWPKEVHWNLSSKPIVSQVIIDFKTTIMGIQILLFTFDINNDFSFQVTLIK